MAKINLTVVGIYFSAAIEVDDAKIATGFTVLDLMREASRQTQLLYQLEPGAGPVRERSMAVIQNVLPDGSSSRSGKVRQPGAYAIAEQAGNERVEAWQYYIERPLAGDPAFTKLVSRTVKECFKTPGMSEELADGDTVIWRCVSILRSPTGRLI